MAKKDRARKANVRNRNEQLRKETDKFAKKFFGEKKGYKK